jgi:hypothetical protein
MVLELFQTVGALVSFITAGFTVYDRLLRYQPFVSVYADRHDLDARPYLRVTNAAPYDIFINSIEIEPPLIALTQQTSVPAMADALTQAKITAVIKPDDNAAFHIVEPPTATDADKRSAERIKIIVHWHRSLSSALRPIPATIWTSLKDIEERKRAAIRAKG